ncbi:MAG: DUF5118 domain-containing protein, partial [Proteobacteria bacterium]|nr:DUF5118 domain-containing protein [Pseudomonadota bacterium]
MLAKEGKKVIVLERNDRLGGCIRTEELFPGFTHDVLSSSYPLFVTSPAYEALSEDLHAAGLEFANTSLPTAVLTEEGRSLIMSTDEAETRTGMFTTQRIDDQLLFEIPEAMLGQDQLLVIEIAETALGIGYGGQAI